MRPQPPADDLDRILERLELTDASDRERKRAIAELAFNGRAPLAWLPVLRQAGYLPYDLDSDQ